LNNSIAPFSVNRQPDKVSDRDTMIYLPDAEEGWIPPEEKVAACSL
jgi:hypothetical protein